MEATKNADLDECFNEFDTNDDDNQENRQLEIHLSGGVFQSKISRLKSNSDIRTLTFYLCLLTFYRS